MTLEATFFALSDGTRLQVVAALSERELSAGEMANRFAVSAPMLSKHLKVLREANLVEEQRDSSDARVRVYRLNGAPFRDLKRWVDEMQIFWRDQLQSFARHVARKHAASRGHSARTHGRIGSPRTEQPRIGKRKHSRKRTHTRKLPRPT